MQFAADAVEGLQLLHTAGVVHGDLNSWNFLVDDTLRLCVLDFAGSTIDGKQGSALEGSKYGLSRSIEDDSTGRTDIFALGSIIYEIMRGEQPYHDLADEEVVRRFREEAFPDLRGLALADIILGCWKGKLKTSGTVHYAINRCLVTASLQTSFWTGCVSILSMHGPIILRWASRLGP